MLWQWRVLRSSEHPVVHLKACFVIPIDQIVVNLYDFVFQSHCCCTEPLKLQKGDIDLNPYCSINGQCTSNPLDHSLVSIKSMRSRFVCIPNSRFTLYFCVRLMRCFLMIGTDCKLMVNDVDPFRSFTLKRFEVILERTH